MNLLILLYLILYIGLAIIRLDWAVLLILATLPTYLIRGQIFGIPFTLLEAMILAAFFIWLITKTEFKNFLRGKYSWEKFKTNKAKRISYPFGWEIALLLIISFIAVAIAGFSNEALGIWKAYFFEPALFFILILNVFVNSGNSNRGDKKNQTTPNPSFLRRGAGMEKILWSLTISALAVSVLAIYQKFTGAWIFNDFWAGPDNRRVVSFFGYPNAVGLYLGPLILVMFGWALKCVNDYFRNKEEIKDKIFNFQFSIFKIKIAVISFTIFLSVLAVYFAKSKGALAGVGVGLIIFVIFSVNKKIRWALIGLLLVTVIGISSYAPVRNYILDKTAYSKSIQIRRVGWQETWEMLKDGRIIFGAGLANYQQVVVPYHQEGIFLKDYKDPDWHRKTVFNAEFREKVWQPLEIYLYPHNIALNFWSEIGLAGMLLFGWIIIKFWVLGARCLKTDIKNKYLVIGLVGAMVVIIVHGLVDVPYFKNDLAIMFWVLIGMMSLLNLRRGS